MIKTVHAFTDDALGDHDATALSELIRNGALSPPDVVSAAINRAHRVQAHINAIEHESFAAALADAQRPRRGVFAGVPIFIKDNTPVGGLPTCYGSRAVPARPARRDGAFARQLLAQGFVCLGKSRLPEFGFNASTEYMDREPVRNPWHTEYSAGASSGGAAALVAAGVVPIAHANDGGGSIRIPAAACGLVGLKPTRGRHRNAEGIGALPINIVSEGVLTRSVRDTARFLAGLEQHWRNPALRPVGQVSAPSTRRLRIGFVQDSVNGQSDAPTRATLLATARLLEDMGHRVTEIPLPFTRRFVDDFVLYWGLLSLLLSTFGRLLVAPDFDARQLETMSRGLARHYRRHALATPQVLLRLRRIIGDYALLFRDYDVLLWPVLTHVTPKLGHLSPAQDYETLIARLTCWVGFTPLNNVTGSPALSLPMGMSTSGLPIGMHFCAAPGDERTLLELAFELEEATPWRRIQDYADHPERTGVVLPTSTPAL